MQRLILFCFVWLVSSACVSAEVVTNGLSISSASTAMKAGYTKTSLEIMPDAGESLEFWQVGQGVLIIASSRTSQKIVRLTFWFADERPKAFRRNFEFDVASFNTSTGIMTIHTKKGEDGVPPSAVQKHR